MGDVYAAETLMALLELVRSLMMQEELLRCSAEGRRSGQGSVERGVA